MSKLFKINNSKYGEEKYQKLKKKYNVSNLQHRLNGYSEEEPSRVNNLKKIISFDLQKNVFVTNIIFSWKPEVLYIS